MSPVPFFLLSETATQSERPSTTTLYICFDVTNGQGIEFLGSTGPGLTQRATPIYVLLGYEEVLDAASKIHQDEN